MHIVWNAALALALLVVFLNGALYLWRARTLQKLPACDAVDELGLFRGLAAFAQEGLALALITGGIPLGWALSGRGAGRGTRGPIILIPGWGLNRGALWYLRRRLLRDGWRPVSCVHYPMFNFDVERAAQTLRQTIQEVDPATQPVPLIGYGVGGLVLRYCVRRYRLPTVRRVVTLGTPHLGTTLPPGCPLRRTLAPGAPLLNKLNAVDHVPQQFDVIAIHSTFDAIVMPPANAEYPGAFNIQVNDVGHSALLFSRKVYQLIAENLAAPLR